jgi:cytochrome P450
MSNVPFGEAEIMSGVLPGLFAQAALDHGPILKHTIRRGQLAGEAFVYMVGPEANRFVLHTHREYFSHALGWTPIIGESLGIGLLNMDDPEHARHRRMWNPAFTSAYMATYLPILRQVIARRTATWPERGVVDLYEESREITFDVAAAALAGFRTGAEVDRLRELFYLLIHGFDGATEDWDTFLARALQAREDLTGMLLALIAERRAAAASAQPRDVLDLIVHARDETGAALSDEQILGHLNILLVAGHETTTTLSTWVLYLLATMPEERARVARELAELPAGADGEPPLDALRGARVLDAFIREAGRLYSPVLNVPRGVAQDFEFAGYTVPKGMHVRLALGASHRLPTIFANPEEFDLDRFLPPREEDRMPYALVTFGGGSRVCIGINFAQIEVKALVAHVLPRYTLTPVELHPPVHAGHWTAIMPGGAPMRIRAR